MNLNGMKIGDTQTIQAADTTLEFPFSASEFFSDVDKALRPLFKEKPHVKVEKKDRLKDTRHPTIGIQYYFDLTDFDGKEKGIWSSHSPWLSVAVYEDRRSEPHRPMFVFGAEYTDGDSGSENKRWGFVASPKDAPNRRTTMKDTYEHLLKVISGLRAKDLTSGGVKGPGYWND